MKTTVKSDNVYKWLAILGSCLFLFSLGARGFYKYHQLLNDSGYTVGTTEYISDNAGLFEVNYHYKIRGKQYQGRRTYENASSLGWELLAPQGNYLVVYIKSNPSISYIFFEKPLNDYSTTDLPKVIDTIQVDLNLIKWYEM